MNEEPLYLKIYNSIYNDILDGKFTSGDKLPSEKDIANEFGVSRITSKKALEMLAEHNLIKRIPGKGSFVLTREDYEQTKPHPEPYLTAMQRHSLQPDRCIVVEDSERGLAAASAAGVDCIIVLNEWTKNGDFSDALAVLEQIGDVPDVILEHTSAS